MCRKPCMKGDNAMLAVDYTNFRDSMKMYMDEVTDDCETMIVIL